MMREVLIRDTIWLKALTYGVGYGVGYGVVVVVVVVGSGVACTK